MTHKTLVFALFLAFALQACSAGFATYTFDEDAAEDAALDGMAGMGGGTVEAGSGGKEERDAAVEVDSGADAEVAEVDSGADAEVDAGVDATVAPQPWCGLCETDDQCEPDHSCVTILDVKVCQKSCRTQECYPDTCLDYNGRYLCVTSDFVDYIGTKAVLDKMAMRDACWGMH